jgi:hypothetical protein
VREEAMSITGDVRKLLAHQRQPEELEGALCDAELLADLFSDVRPIPYIVPIERFAGLPILGEEKSSFLP